MQQSIVEKLYNIKVYVKVFQDSSTTRVNRILYNGSAVQENDWFS